MPGLNQKGVVHVILLLLLLGGIAATVWLVTAGPLKLLPRASVSSPLTQQTSLTLNPLQTSYTVGEEVVVQVLVRSDIDAANLFEAKIRYDQSSLSLGRVDTTSPFIKNWVEQYWADPGQISLIGAVPNPGFKTNIGDTAVMATLYFRSLKMGETTVSFTDESAIYRNSDNLNILNIKNHASILTGGRTPSLPITPTPTPTSQPSPTPVACRVILTDFTLHQSSECTRIGSDWGKSAEFTCSDGFRGIVQRSTCTTSGDLRETAASTCNRRICPSPTPTLTPRPSATPAPGTGDGNNDGKINLVDLSVLLTDFNKTGGFRPSIDLNGDGVINTFDFSLMRNLLIQNKVIKG